MYLFDKLTAFSLYLPFDVRLQLLLPELNSVRRLHAGWYRADAERGHQPFARCCHASSHFTFAWLLAFITGFLC